MVWAHGPNPWAAAEAEQLVVDCHCPLGHLSVPRLQHRTVKLVMPSSRQGVSSTQLAGARWFVQFDGGA